MRKTKLYYIIEEIDIDGDKNNDGMLISQYRLDKYGDKIFLKNKYVSFNDYYKHVKNLKKGGQIQNMNIDTNPKLIVLTNEQFNALMNNHNKTQPLLLLVVVSNNGTFVEKLGVAAILGAGATAGNMLVESIVNNVSSLFSE